MWTVKAILNGIWWLVDAAQRRRQIVRERAQALYFEFVAVASKEKQRAKQFVLLAPHSNSPETHEKLNQLDSQRHPHSVELQRLASLLRLLEGDAELLALIPRLVEEMAFEPILLAIPFREPYFSEALERFRAAWLNYEKMVCRLTNRVHKVHIS